MVMPLGWQLHWSSLCASELCFKFQKKRKCENLLVQFYFGLLLLTDTPSSLLSFMAKCHFRNFGQDAWDGLKRRMSLSAYKTLTNFPCVTLFSTWNKVRLQKALLVLRWPFLRRLDLIWSKFRLNWETSCSQKPKYNTHAPTHNTVK